MIDGGDDVEKPKLQIRQGKIVGVRRRQRLKLTREVVAEIADRTAEEGRVFRRTGDTGFADELREVLKGSLAAALISVGGSDGPGVVLSPQDLVRVGSEERVASGSEWAFSALEEK